MNTPIEPQIRDTDAHGPAREEYAQTIDLDDDRTVGERYELSFRCTRQRDLVTRWSVQLVARSLTTLHAETLFGSGRASIDTAPNRRRGVAPGIAADDFDTAYRFYERHWRALLTTAASAARNGPEQRHHTEALVLYGHTWRSTSGRALADRLGSFAAITVLALATDPAFHVMQRAAAHHPEPVTLAIYHPHEQRLDLTLIDTDTVETLIHDPGPLRTGPDPSAGTLLTGPHTSRLLHPGYIGSTTTTGRTAQTPPTSTLQGPG